MRKKRVCDYIAEAVQNEILSGRMEKGMPLRQEELAEQLGYSRIPIREALQMLESQGLAKRLATRHVVVADVSNQVIRENFDLFFDVELMTMENMQKKAVLWRETVLQENAEESFHQFLIENSTNEYFVRILENALDCYIRFATEETKDQYNADIVLSIGSRSDEDTIAQHLYTILRECDELNVEAIYSESFSTPRIGQAIMNRLLKAAGHQVITAVEVGDENC